MENITINSRKRRIRAPHKLIKSYGKNCRVYYSCPKSTTDKKRWGREMEIITTDNTRIELDGRAINAIKSVLKRAGELD